MTKFLNNADVTGYISQTSVTSSLLKTDSSGKLVAAVAGTDYNAPDVSAVAGTLIREIRNTTGATLTKGTVVYISGATGNKATVSKALATGDSTSAQTFGLCQTDIANNSNGYVVCVGDITGLDTSAFTEGVQLYLSSTTAGAYTSTKQYAPAHLVYIGIVTRSHPTLGQIEVKIQNGYELDEIHNVAAQTPSNNEGLFYETATSLWKNKTIATVLGYTPVDASLTANYVPKATGATTLANSNIQDSGSLITLGSNSYVNGNLAVGANSSTLGEKLFIQGDASTSTMAITTSANSGISTLSANIDRGLQGGVSIIADKTNQQGIIRVNNSDWWNLIFQVRGSDGTLERMRIANTGAVGIGATTLGQHNLRISKIISGSATSYSTLSDGVINSTVGTAYYNRTSASTLDAVFTLTNIYHYSSSQGTFGASSSVTNQFGFVAENSLTGATNNYGFYGNIAAAAGRWNLYMAGTAANYMAGSLGIGSTGLTGYSLRVSKNITGATSAYGIRQDGTVQSDVTTAAIGIWNTLNTAASAFTLPSYSHINITQGTIGSGSSVTSQYGIFIDSTLTGATSNFGIYGNIAAAANRWNLYMNGTADNYLAGSLGIGSTVLTGFSLRMTKVITGATTSYAVSQEGAVQSDVTSAYGFRNFLNTQAATFTLTNYVHYDAAQNPLGTNSSVTNQFGFSVGSSLSGATNNYGFYSNLTAASGRWNLYMNGNALNYLSGSLGVGSVNLTAYNLRVSKNITGNATSTGISSEGVIQSDVTTWARLYNTYFDTVAAAFTLTNVSHYITSQGAIGSGSAVTNQHGFYVDSSLTGATNNYGFYGNIASGTNRWNLYMNGTAQNYLAGALSIGVTTANASALLQLDSTTKGFLPPRMTATQRAAISTPAEGLVVFQTDGTIGLYVYANATWRTLAMV